MIFTLEVLDADHGDALLLHYGQAGRPRLVVIDGGPAGVYAKSLKPRLLELRQRRAPGDTLDIDLLLVSHIDDDHIAGVVDLLRDVQRGHGGASCPFDVKLLWHNSFDDLVSQASMGAAAGTITPATVLATALDRGLPQVGAGSSPLAAAMLASVAQGRELRNLAGKLGIPVNLPFGGLITAPAAGSKRCSLGDGLTLTLIAPPRNRVDKLGADWAKKVKALKAKEAKGRGKAGEISPAEMDVLIAEYLDNSLYNLSSIVVLAECDGKRMLLTGDCRGDIILEGLERAGCLKNDTLHVDVLKLPHHGSSRDVKQKFFEQVTADHYVVSANGTYGNPDDQTFEQLFKARHGAAYKVHLTYPKGGRRSLTAMSPAGVGILIRNGAALSTSVDLIDPL